MSTTGAVDDRSTPLDRVLVSAFLEHIPDYVYFKDRESRFLAVSQSLARYLGCAAAQDLVGRSDRDFFTAADAQEALDDEQRIVRTGQPLLNKLERQARPDGRTHWVLTHKLPLRDASGTIIGTFGVSKDVTRAKSLERELEQAHKDLVDASRVAGMAEVATGVLHNVGNVLNSLNVSASVLTTALRQSKADSLAKLAALLREHERAGDLGSFLTTDPRGSRVPEFLESLGRHRVEERERLRQEIAALQQNIDHVKEIVSMQQAYATMLGVVEPLDPALLMEDALRMNANSLARHGVTVERDFPFVPAVHGEKAKVLQILVNLIRNARHACDESGRPDKRLVLRLRSLPAAEPDQPARVEFIVADNGVGIPAENLTRIFQHGFTTRKNGHGFGLHSSANAARELKGQLRVQSDGAGCGATFTLDLPAAPPCVPIA